MSDELTKVNTNFKKAKKAIEAKQDTIEDLDTIRAGAKAGATALQSVPEDVALKSDIPDTTTFATNTSVDEKINDKLGNVSVIDWDEIDTSAT